MPKELYDKVDEKVGKLRKGEITTFTCTFPTCCCCYL